jgi:hypothetical protein
VVFFSSTAAKAKPASGPKLVFSSLSNKRSYFYYSYVRFVSVVFFSSAAAKALPASGPHASGPHFSPFRLPHQSQAGYGARMESIARILYVIDAPVRFDAILATQSRQAIDEKHLPRGYPIQQSGESSVQCPLLIDLPTCQTTETILKIRPGPVPAWM